MELPDTTMKPVAKSIVVQSEELVGQQLFLYNDSDDTVHTLNSGAAMIWLLCDGSRNLDEIASNVVSESNLTKEEMATIVQETIQQFQEIGLLEV